MDTKDLRDIRHSVTFKATPHQVYEALMDSAQHAKFTGAPADISREVGGGFTAYDGALLGTNQELVPDRKIVQLWRAESDDWPPEHFSVATFTIEPENDGTLLTFVQTGVPAHRYESIDQGWHEYYWTKMKEWMES